MALLGWMKQNILPTIVLVLTIIIGIGGVTLTICGVRYILDYASYDTIFEDGSDDFKREFLARGLLIVFLGVIMVITIASGCAMIINDATCPRIYFLVNLWCLAVLIVTGFSLCLSSQEPADKEDEGFYLKIMRAMDDAFIREYGIDRFTTPTPSTTTTSTPVGKKKFDAVNATKTTEGSEKLPVSKLFDLMHKKLQCCGSDGLVDFASAREWPKSCCPHLDWDEQCPKTLVFGQGCKTTLVQAQRDTVLVLTGLTGFFFCVTLLAAVCTTVFVCVGCLSRLQTSSRRP